jgi:AcrR family transcriptional regulator
MGTESRTYKSELREQRAAETREKILSAVLVVMSKDPTGFSVPAVAREAGVSVPTVYRYYPNKLALVDAIRERSSQALNVSDAPTGPSEISELTDFLRGFARAWSAQPAEIRRMTYTPVMEELRASKRAARLAWVEEVFADHLSELPEDERAAARDLIVVLSSSMGLDALQQYAGLDVDTAVDRVDWAIRKLLGKKRRRAKRGKKK